eukprot:TRINITY_DN22529_c0_g1_i1.p1 TRINITY_DN22529_c0_g1~~TRINITY_DN22529_c0_g1_i1.p1  ORF type:complete len:357 (+),score=56.76 TRINITY_DN22529_c0_g1_i1:33-1073(+)
MIRQQIAALAAKKTKTGAYLRLIRADKPIGSWLLLLPCWWGQGMGWVLKGGAAPLDVMGAFTIGAFCMRSAGCIINDMWDRDFDKKVERTKNRPIAAGDISVKTAFGYLTAHMTAGLGILLTLHPHSVLVGAMSVPLIVVYPLCKRITYLPQLFLGLTFNWGVLVGVSSVCHTINWFVIAPLYASGIFWTLLYDTVYAHQDKKDDVAAGVRSSALLIGDTKVPLHVFNLAMTLLLSTSGYMAALNPLFHPWVAASSAALAASLHVTDLSSPQQCARFFKANKWFGLSIVFAIFVCGYLREEEEEKEERKREESENGFGANLHLRENIQLIKDVLSGERQIGWDLVK